MGPAAPGASWFSLYQDGSSVTAAFVRGPQVPSSAMSGVAYW
ncbi:hypothetical protein [Streptomyces sp. WAC07061]|nr:hypothetical protein [Streptomyces sp. WAC07061]